MAWQKKIEDTEKKLVSRMAAINIMKRDELLMLVRHMKIPNKSTADANGLRDALRENGAIDDKDQITPVGEAALARKIWKKEDIKNEFINRGFSRRSKTKIEDLVDLGVEYGFLDENYHVIGGEGDEAGPSETVELIPEPEIPVAYKKDELLVKAKEAGLKGLQNTSQDRLLQILKDHNLVARNSVIAPKTRPDVSARLKTNHAIKRNARAAAASAAAAAVIAARTMEAGAEAAGAEAAGAEGAAAGVDAEFAAGVGAEVGAGVAAEGAAEGACAEGAGAEVAVPISERFSSIKMSLNSFMTQEGHLLPICDAVNAMKKLTIEAYIFANLHVIRLLEENKPVCLLDDKFFYNCLSLVSGDTYARRIPEMRDSADIYMSCRPANYATIDRSILEGMLQNCSLQMETATKNHVSENLYARMKRYCWLKFDMDGSEQYKFLKDVFDYDNVYESKYGVNGCPVDAVKQHFRESMPRPTKENMQKHPEQFMKVLWEIERFNRFDLIPRFTVPNTQARVEEDDCDSNEGLDRLKRVMKAIGKPSCDQFVFPDQPRCLKSRALAGEFEDDESCRLAVMAVLAEKKVHPMRAAKIPKKHVSLKGLRGFSLLPLAQGFNASYIKIDTTGLRALLNAAKIQDLPLRTNFLEQNMRYIYWRNLFNIADMETDARKFHDEILTDGKAVSVIFRVKTFARPEGEADPMLAPLRAEDYDRIWGLDPGTNDVYVATDNKGHTINCSSAEFYHDSKYHYSNDLIKRWRKKNVVVAGIERRTPIKKTSDFTCMKTYAKFVMINIDMLQSFYGAQRFKNLKFLRYCASKKKLHQMCLKFGKNALVGVGDWSAQHGSGFIKGCRPGPNARFKRELAKYTRVIDIDEDYTSKTCNCCHQRNFVNMRSKKKCKDGVTRTSHIHSVLHCKTSGCLSITVNRDVNASRNILELTLCIVYRLSRPVWLSRQ